ncbi:MAG: hypothetical protein Q7U13_11600 [Rhodoferax sp.]|nr:hypothetical protein [Rhodoferax sp.]
MSDITVLAAAFGFVVALFTLYRLLVERQDKTIALLKEEISFRLNNKDRLAEISAFYEAEKRMLETRLAAEGANREQFERELLRANEALSNVRQIETAVAKDQTRTDALFDRMKADLQIRLQFLMEQNASLSFEVEKQRANYVELCEKVKERYGLATIIELTARSEYEEAKLRRQHISRQKHNRGTSIRATQHVSEGDASSS